MKNKSKDVFLIHQMDSTWTDISVACDKYFIVESMEDVKNAALYTAYPMNEEKHNFKDLPVAIAEFNTVTELFDYLNENNMHICYEGMYCYDGTFTITLKQQSN